MVVVEVDSSDEVDLLLEVLFVHHVFIELPLEEVRDLLLDRLICDLGCPPHGAIAPRIGPLGVFKAAAAATALCLRASLR
jgi:hypothetical protein